MRQTLPPTLLEALLNAWDRSNTIMVRLLAALPEGGLDARATPGGPSVGAVLTHVRAVRVNTVLETGAFEQGFARVEVALVPDDEEWLDNGDSAHIRQMLDSSAEVVRSAVQHWLEAGRGQTGVYAHPALLLQHLLWHEAYHVGQIKLALKLSNLPMTDQEAGPVTWELWKH